ncbi:MULTISPECIES: hypothetical protein [unclassified Streptomyces]|uniref:hypothetical protein n=1 Tax=unclassified Streptomyces TaxID=2593676 RepID=UPI0035D79652
MLKVIKWMYATRDGEGVQLAQGHIQLNVIWEYGKDVVRVQRTDDKTPFKDVRTFPIPSDYRGKSPRDIAAGMREHVLNVCRIMWRAEYGQDGVDELNNEWAMVTKYPTGTKVAYGLTTGDTLLGVVVGHKRGSHVTVKDRAVEVRVTSRKHPHYKCGEILSVSANAPWLKVRGV